MHKWTAYESPGRNPAYYQGVKREDRKSPGNRSRDVAFFRFETARKNGPLTHRKEARSIRHCPSNTRMKRPVPEHHGIVSMLFRCFVRPSGSRITTTRFTHRLPRPRFPAEDNPFEASPGGCPGNSVKPFPGCPVPENQGERGKRDSPTLLCLSPPWGE